MLAIKNKGSEIHFMRATTKAMQYIVLQAKHFDLDTKKLLAQTKAILMVYRQVVWSVQNRANLMRREIAGTYGMQLSTALIYLSDFAPMATRDEFEAKVSSLFRSKWLVELTDLSLQYVRDYPVYGDIYAQILQLRFMQETSRTDEEVSELLGLERSTYYDRKKEAILLMGISLWGYVIPTTMSVYRRVELMSVPEEDFFTMVSAEQTKSRSKSI